MKKYTAAPLSSPAGTACVFKICNRRVAKTNTPEATLEGRLSQRAAPDVLQDLNGIQTLCAESNHAVDGIKYSSHQATPKDRLHVRKSLPLSKNSCVVHFFLPSTPSSLRPRKSRMAFPIS